MNATANPDIELIFLGLAVLLILITLYAAWMNLVRKRISPFGLDALILLLFSRKKAAMIRKDPRLIRRLGVMMLLLALGTISQEASLFFERILPNSR
jgi:hypothetical protein